jgi:hypothetical protein
MTGRAAAVQGGLAALGLVIAYSTWQREPERAPGAVTIIDAAKSDVTKIHYEDETSAVDMTRGKGGSDPMVWLHVVTKPKPEDTKKDDKKDDKAPAKDDKKTTTAAKQQPPRDLGGGEGAAKVFDQFAPFVSPRAFGVLDKDKLKEIGLDAPKRKLEVTVKGDVRRYEIGQPANATGGESFLRDVSDGRVYLMPRSMLGELSNAGHMVDRRLHAFELNEFDRFVMSSGGKQKEYIQVGKESRATAGFASPKTPDKRDQMAKNWHDSLWRMFPVEILGRGEEPAGGKPTLALRVDYYDGKKSVGWLELGRIEGAGTMSDESGAASGQETYVRTEHTVGWCKLGNGGQLVPDAQKLIAAP